MAKKSMVGLNSKGMPQNEAGCKHTSKKMHWNIQLAFRNMCDGEVIFLK